MRWGVLLVLAAACYRPALDGERCVRCGANGECPGDLECIGGICGGGQTCTQPADGAATDSADDATRDGAPSRDCTLSSFDDAQLVALGALRPDENPASFTTDASGTFGAFKYTNVEIGITLLAGMTMFDTVIQDGTAKYYAPHLSPEGTEIFVQTDDLRVPNDPYRFGVSYRTNTTWSAPRPITLRDAGMPIIVGGLVFPSTPTAYSAGPRLMMFLRDPTALVELQESSAEIWDLKETYAASAFGLERVYHPQLSSDGRVVVFVGEAPPGVFAIYASVRGDRAQRFGGLTFAIRTGIPYEHAHPFLSDDCRTLYYYDLGAGVVKFEH